MRVTARHAVVLGLALPWVLYFLEPGAHLDTPAGLPLLHLIHLAFVAAVLTLFYGAGSAALEAAGLRPEDRAERALLSVCAGFFLVCLVLFILASAGLLRAPLVWLLAAAGAFWLIREDRRQEVPSLAPPRDAFRAQDWHEAAGRGGWPDARVAAWALGLLLALLFLGSLVEALYASPQSPDALAYHAAYPRLFAQSGGYVFTPESPHFFAYSAYWELFLSGVALFVPSDVSLLSLAQLFHLALGLGGTALAIFCVVRCLVEGGWWTRAGLALFGAALYAGMRPDVQHVRLFPLLAVAPKSDLFVATLQVAALLPLWRAAEAAGPKRALHALLAGGLLGVAAGVKLTGGLAVVGLGAAFVLFPPLPLATRERFRVAGWAAVGVTVALLPMLAKNAVAIGDPIYPVLASYFGRYVNPWLFATQSGLRTVGEGWTGLPMLLLLFPSAPFLLLIGAAWRSVVPRGVHFLLLAVAVSVLVGGFVFSGSFSLRYVLFIPAFGAVATAGVAGGLIGRMRAQRGTGRLLASPHAMTAAWGLLFVLAALPTHLDNRIRRAFTVVRQTPSMRARVFAMSPTSRFQAGWVGRLPEGARPLSLFRPERLFAFSGGWRPVVALESPGVARLMASVRDPEALERALAALGFTHVYFQPAHPLPPDYPLQPGAFISYLRRRAPLWREAGFEMYAIGAGAPQGKNP